jgi:hypothetical protein
MRHERLGTTAVAGFLSLVRRWTALRDEMERGQSRALWRWFGLGLVVGLAASPARSSSGSIFGLNGECYRHVPADRSTRAAQPVPPQAEARSFGPDIRVDDGTTYSVDVPMLTIDSQGYVHTVFAAGVESWIEDQVCYSWKRCAEDAWHMPSVHVLPEPEPFVWRSATATYRDGVAVAWMCDQFGNPIMPRFARSHIDHEFDEPSKPLDGELADQERFQIQVYGLRGKIYLLWEEQFGADWHPRLVVSDDNGATWSFASGPIHPGYPLEEPGISAVVLAHGQGNELYLAYHSQNDRVAFWRSFDGGMSWTGPSFADDGLGISLGTGMAVAPDGTIGVVWSDGRTDGTADLFFSRSTDGGETWTSPGVLINALWPEGNYYDPHLTVDSRGRWHLACVWNMPWQPAVNAYYTSSLDGEQWTLPERVNDEFGSVHPNVPRTVSMVVDPDGFAHLAWTHRDASFDEDAILYSTNRRVTVGLASDIGLPVPAISGLPNPVNQPLVFRVEGLGSGLGDVVIFDVAGRPIRRWLFGGADTRSLTWNLHDEAGDAVAAGAYFLRARAGRELFVQKLVVAR